MDLANFERRANSGAPVVGARATLYGASAVDPTTPLATTFTDANGYWAFTGMAVGSFDVLVEAPGSGYKKWYKGLVKIGVDQLSVASGLNLAPGTVPGASLVNNSVTTTQIADNTILNADVNSAAGIAYGKLNLAGGIVNADIAAAAAIAVTKLAAGGVANRLVGTYDGASIGYVLAPTGMLALGSAAGLKPTQYSTAQSIASPGSLAYTGMTGSGLVITSTGGTILFGVSLMDLGCTSAATINVQIWEQPTSFIANVSGEAVPAGLYKATTNLIVVSNVTLPAGAHNLFLAWKTTAGTITANAICFWALEIKTPIQG